MGSVLEKYLAALKSYPRTGVILIVGKMQRRIRFLGEVSSLLSTVSVVLSEVFAPMKVFVSKISLPQTESGDHFRDRCLLSTLERNVL